MKIFIATNYVKDQSQKILNAVCEKLNNLSIEYILNENINQNNDFIYIDRKSVAKCDIIIIIGGDGTIMHVAKQCVDLNLPVLGINSGRLGFMAGLEPEEIQQLDRLLKKEYDVQVRLMLDVTLVTGDQSKTFTALNEAVLSRESYAKIIDLELILDNKSFDSYRADGIIIATPTGSTAYSLSAGGPILDPEIECMTISPICPHSLVCRSIVLSTKSTIKIIPLSKYENSDSSIYLCIDGTEKVSVLSGSFLTIKKSNESIKLIKMKQDSFYQVIRNKFLTF